MLNFMSSSQGGNFRRATGRTAFSLVEILVVTVIIAVLVAISFPFLTRGMSYAKTTKAISNMRNIYLGLLSYNQDNGRLPPCVVAAGTDSWNIYVVPYIDPNFKPSSSQGYQLPQVFFDPAVITNKLRGDFGVLVDNTYGPFCSINSLPLLRLAQPSRTPLIFTAEQKNSKGEVVGSFFTSNYASLNAGSPGVPMISERHNGKALIIFADGSTASMTKKDLFDDDYLPFRNR